ncbi:hypothetical protein QY049_17640 [Bradyrhizobium sp. WYCCWR 13022]|uniref:hypothetical protein n=1 Tax=unclassified Bradyrhizobium TaxID=2631580 RepID=UPI00263AEDEA|nr:hypothetical protein [Bradyrhizobium sp. WYCCWR 13022]MDN4985032.1 hypothetical protein [Bradyrhizobium sp. WYCCWR 13022]
MERRQMPQTGAERQSVRQMAICGLVFVCTAISVGLLLRVGWRDWTLFAGLWAAMYFMGGMRWFPWGTPFRKAFSAGVFVGTVLPALEWAAKLQAS